ncbi:MAG: Gfo/Idh/MocA family oxidoreductase [Pirellulaceae bacterium]|nr:Gfo/Idh/MocA family oxidoreductase [Pirellulaceae bacterium]
MMIEQNLNSSSPSGVSRRGFLRNTSLGLAAAATMFPRVHAAEGPELEIKIGLIGCGGRGTGAVLDAVGAATKVIYPQSGYHTEDVAEGATIEKKNIKVIALADIFEDRLDRCRQNLQRLGMDIPKERCFIGFDAYKQVLAEPEVNYVILASPPHFRPVQLMAAIQAGKHVFAEKPVAVDVPGVRMVIEAGKLAQQKALGIGAGTQRRHMKSYQEAIQRIRDGAIGELVYGKCYWNGGQIWVIDRQEGWSDLEWQLRNWNYFTWLSGDHYVEQHVHNLDIMNWVLGSHPVRAVSGVGGRQVRTGDRHGHIYDHFAVEFEYPGGISMFSQARQINGCRNLVEEAVVGTGGRSNCKDFIEPKNGERWRFRDREPSPYRQSHENLIDSIRIGKPLNEAQTIAEATMTGILGREAVYSGQAIDWDTAIQSETRLGPDEYSFGAYPIPPVPMPGVYRFT